MKFANFEKNEQSIFVLMLASNKDQFNEVTEQRQSLTISAQTSEEMRQRNEHF